LKIKLTPLNIVSSICLVIGVLLLFSRKPYDRSHYVDITGTLAGLSFLSAVVFFVSDLIFRKFVANLKKLWIIEGVLVIFIVILVFIIKSSIS
jgi:hypothetical protein